MGLFAKIRELPHDCSTLKNMLQSNGTVASPCNSINKRHMINQLMNDIFHSKDIFISINQKCVTSHNKFWHHLADSMWHDTYKIFVLLHEFFLENAITYIHKEVYSSAKVLHVMDMAGGQLSIEGIEVLCTCETNGAKYYCNSILPCSVDI